MTFQLLLLLTQLRVVRSDFVAFGISSHGHGILIHVGECQPWRSCFSFLSYKGKYVWCGWDTCHAPVVTR